MQRVKSAFTRIFNALWLRRTGIVPHSEFGMTPDQQRTAYALRGIRGTMLPKPRFLGSIPWT
jgi:hypothetical protein